MKRCRVAALAAMASVLGMGVGLCQTQAQSHAAGRKSVSFRQFGDKQSSRCLIVLHGASGPAVPLYAEQAAFFGEHGFHVLMPLYFEATRSAAPNVENERAWVAVVDDFVSQCRKEPATRQVFLMGFSLGASVALAAGSQGAVVDGVVDWYGSLPDEFFSTMTGMPPLLILHGSLDTNIPLMNAQQLVKLCELKDLRCESHFYADQGHGFTGAALRDADERTLKFMSSFVPTPGSK